MRFVCTYIRTRAKKERCQLPHISRSTDRRTMTLHYSMLRDNHLTDLELRERERPTKSQSSTPQYGRLPYYPYPYPYPLLLPFQLQLVFCCCHGTRRRTLPFWDRRKMDDHQDARRIGTSSCTDAAAREQRSSQRTSSNGGIGSNSNGSTTAYSVNAHAHAHASTVPTPTLLATQSSNTPAPPPPPNESASNNNNNNNSSNNSNSSKNSPYSYMNSVRQQITGMMDDQRLHRLQQCRILQEVLSDCRKSSSSRSSSRSSSTNQQTDATDTTTRRRRLELEDVPAGIRMVRYFNWRDYKAPDVLVGTSDHDTDSHKSKSTKKEIRSNNNSKQIQNNNGNHCLREEHAVWACRSVALQCGAPLAQLKSCFTDAGADAVLDSANQTAYEPDYNAPETVAKNNSSSGSGTATKTPCQWQQQALGDCVAAAAVQLQERQESKASTSTSTPDC
jgi:hypothetical protein